MNVSEMIMMMSELCRKMIKQEELLCRLDSGIGDGDHGVTVARGFRAADKALKSKQFSNPGEMFYEAGKALEEAMGGAIGPIIGSFLQAGGSLTKEEWSCHEFADFFVEGLEQVCIIGGAKEGERTLVDALAPGVRAFLEEVKRAEESGEILLGENACVTACLRCAYEAAGKGAQSTKEMMAKRGRARFLREKSIGYVDAGAITVTLLFRFMLEYMEELII